MRRMYFDIDGSLLVDDTGEPKTALAKGAFERALHRSGFEQLICVGSFVDAGRAAKAVQPDYDIHEVIFDICGGVFSDKEWFTTNTLLTQDSYYRATEVDLNTDWWYLDQQLPADNEMNIDELRFPIGPFTAPDIITPAQVKSWIDEMGSFPAALKSVVEPMTQAQLDTPYRPDGWTVKQVVHHLPDSHLNSYVRFKWALTEDHPTIKIYFEDRWARLRDYADEPIAV